MVYVPVCVTVYMCAHMFMVCECVHTHVQGVYACALCHDVCVCVNMSMVRVYVCVHMCMMCMRMFIVCVGLCVHVCTCVHRPEFNMDIFYLVQLYFITLTV